MASQSLIVCANFDVTAAATTYMKLTQNTIQGDVVIATSGSSATTTGTNAFALMGVGDQLNVSFKDGTTLNRTITAKATDSSVTVHAVWDLTGGFHHRWRDFNVGTVATFGWYDISNLINASVYIDIQTIAATNVTVSTELNDGYSSGVVVVASSVLTAAGRTVVPLTAGYPRCRVGALVTGDAGVQDVTISIVGDYESDY